MKCSYCGTDYEGNFCPECGAKSETQAPKPNIQSQQFNSQQPKPTSSAQEVSSAYQNPINQKKQKKVHKPKKPIYKRWWVYAIAAVVLLTIVGSISGGNKSEKLNWNDIVLGEQIPQPPAKKGEIDENSSDELRIDVDNITDKQYNDYVEACKSKGFEIDAESDSSSYEAYNSEGYKLSLSHYGSKSELTIDLEKPMEFSAITWPDSKAGKELPTPKSKVGKFSWEHDDDFLVYIGNTSKDDYNDYVKACSDKGFKVDYDKGDNYYYAESSSGCHVSLEYLGNNIMSIEIDASKSSEETTAKPEKTKPASTEPSTKAAKTAEPKTTEGKKNNEKLVNGMRKDFKEAMDSYEEFMDEYVAFMEKYYDNPSDLGLLADYAKYMSKYSDMVDKFDEWESEDLNDAELEYYIDVQARVSKKLLKVAG